MVAILEGDIARGVGLVQEAAQLCHTVGNIAALALAFCNLALAAALQGETRRAMMLLGGMDRLMGQVKMRLIAPDLFEYEETMKRVQTQANEKELDGWRQEGYALAYEDALALLLETA